MLMKPVSLNTLLMSSFMFLSTTLLPPAFAPLRMLMRMRSPLDAIYSNFVQSSTLKIKETDRIEALKREMRKLGYVIHDVNNCELFWDGERCEPNMEAGIDTYEDHRMALAFAPAALRVEGLRINNPLVVTKSYPKFWEDLREAQFEVKSEE